MRIQIEFDLNPWEYGVNPDSTEDVIDLVRSILDRETDLPWDFNDSEQPDICVVDDDDDEHLSSNDLAMLLDVYVTTVAKLKIPYLDEDVPAQKKSVDRLLELEYVEYNRVTGWDVTQKGKARIKHALK